MRVDHGALRNVSKRELSAGVNVDEHAKAAIVDDHEWERAILASAGFVLAVAQVDGVEVRLRLRVRVVGIDEE